MVEKQQFVFRRVVIIGLFFLAACALLWRAFDLHISSQVFLQKQGDARHIRTVAISAHRGNIYDRNGEPLAISTPVDSVWINPQQLDSKSEALQPLADLLQLNFTKLEKRLQENASREFMYVKRRVQPDLAEQVKNLAIEGVYLQREYQRFYPTGEVSAHVLGFTNVDDKGQEGVELSYEAFLAGKPGAKKIIRDRLGRAVDDVEKIQSAQPGQDLTVSIDKRLQYLAYRSLKSAMQKHKAKSASAVVMDVRTGEVLAMVNQPSFNPNDRSDLRPEKTRNRAVTDLYEPGSTIKPVTMLAALDSGKWKATDFVGTAPGYMRLNGAPIKDIRNFGWLSLPAVIYKSSNVGISKLALSISQEQQWHIYRQFGLGQSTDSGFPGETAGHFDYYKPVTDFERATLAFGYGMSVTPLQLTRIYATIANHGVMNPVSFLKQTNKPEGEQIVAAKIAKEVSVMMEKTVSSKGTGIRAGVINYRVAGKTGTVHKPKAGGYEEDSYQSVFAGFAPASDPRLAMVVVIDEPTAGEYYGGRVAAPVFSNVMMNAMRLLDIAPDKLNLGKNTRADKKQAVLSDNSGSVGGRV
ncbi:MAG: penicillin-binding transpeptidase domain-containing protein [Gammaproteobacteria bacterium]|nr:penicillin-binding transpeptidase domain-containing protein [Gammaproteobacteria bacterium]